MNTFTINTFTRALIFAAVACASQTANAGQPLVCLIQPSQIAEVGTSVTGVIESVRVERGDYVKKGEVIAVLRGEVERAALDVAKSKAQADADVRAALANVDYARQRLTRAEDLFNKKFISEQALDQTRTESQVAMQKLAQAREQRRVWEQEMGLAQSQLSQRTIVSPISGIVAERYLSTGERVEERSIARVVSINPLHVEVMVPTAHFGKVKTGMTATVMPELPGAPSVEARVNLVDKLIDGASNTFRVRLELPNPGGAIPAGQRCKVAFGDQIIGATNSASKPSLRPATSSTPTTAPAPAATAPSAPKAATLDPIEKSALSALESWRQAWESKNLAGYLAAYVADFRGESASREVWLKQREARIRKSDSPDISVSDAYVRSVARNKIQVHFLQKYRAGNYRDDSLKSLLMILEKGKWLILEERTLP